MLDQIKTMMQLVLMQDDLFDLAAQTMKKSLDAYMKQGFSRAEAIQLLLHQGSLVKGSG